MKIVFDMDNTLVDEMGSTKRPNIDTLLQELYEQKHNLILWTSSTKERAKEILSHHNLNQYFERVITREQYDPNSKGIPKDCTKIKADILIDDDPKEIRYNQQKGVRSYQIPAYRQNTKTSKRDIEDLRNFIHKKESLAEKITKYLK